MNERTDGWLTDWLTDWLSEQTDCLVGRWIIYSSIHSSIHPVIHCLFQRDMLRKLNRLNFSVFTVLQSTSQHRSRRLSSVFCHNHAQCKNGGFCILSHCTCDVGYTGSFCETRLQCKNDFDCLQKGKCELDSQTNTTFCNCNMTDGRYEGVFCQRKVDCHVSGNCLNNGQCQRDSVVTNKFYCQCRLGFTGPNCQDKTYCTADNNCSSGGICLNSSIVEKNKCKCDEYSGYTGYFCGLRVTPGMSWYFGTAQTSWIFFSVSFVIGMTFVEFDLVPVYIGTTVIINTV